MNTLAVQFLATLAPFTLLSPQELAQLGSTLSLKQMDKGRLIAVQGKTVIQEVYIVHNGQIDLYYETEGRRFFSGGLGQGSVFGGISILMNGGLSTRTAEVRERSEVYVLPKTSFLDICTRYPSIYHYFADLFTQRTLNGDFDAVVAAQQALSFISNVIPFTFLPQTELASVGGALSFVFYPKNTQLFIQGQSRLQYLYIIQKGAAERYFEDRGQKMLQGVIGEGQIFGGISILLNDGVAVRSLKTIEDTYCYILPKERFIQACRNCDQFREFFTDTFGQRMLDRSYAAIITKSSRPTSSTLQFFDQSVDAVVRKHPVHCDGHVSIRQAAQLMSQNECSSIFISDETDRFVGIVTDHDLRKKVIAGGMDSASPVFSIMSAPLVSMPAQALVFETLMQMMQRQVKHMAVTDAGENVIGMVTSQDLLIAQGQSPIFLIRQIQTATGIEDVMDKHARLPQLIQRLIHSGLKAKNVTRLITTLSDAILTKLIQFALEKLGPPPTDFVFMVLGSEGRQEQTLKTDQDNAIVFRDVGPQAQSAVMDYFLSFGEMVCNWLDKAGYAFCKGGVMAKNTKWCQPLSVWKQNFYEWIHAATPQDLLQASIFFDFRGAWGDFGLIDELRTYLFASLEGWAGFFRNLTENALHFKPPIGFFRNFVVESKGEHKDAFDIKSAMLPIVDFARIYALKHGIAETNTVDRLHQIYLKHGITKSEYQELEQAYAFMMQLRFASQVSSVLDTNKSPDNYIKPKELSSVEQTTLKEIFKRVEKCQAKLGFEFTGIG